MTAAKKPLPFSLDLLEPLLFEPPRLDWLRDPLLLLLRLLVLPLRFPPRLLLAITILP
ncbi:MAG: hypothetical protein ABR588_08135 [Sphingomicrobium sp.]